MTKGLTWLLRKKASGKVAKVIPVVGGAAVMGFNAGSMYFLGEKYINACWEYTLERLQAEIQMGEP